MTDYKQLCAELLEAVDNLPWEYDWKGHPVGPFANIDESLFDHARTALAEHEPEGPSDEDLYDLFDWLKDEWHSNNEKEFPLPLFARAILVRWGRLTSQPVAVSERLPGPEDCDAEGRCWWYGEGGDMVGWTLDAEGLSYYQAKYWLPAQALPAPTNG